MDRLDPPDAEAAYAALREELAQAQRDLEAARASGTAADTELSQLRADVVQLRADLAAARIPAPALTPAPRGFLADVFPEE